MCWIDVGDAKVRNEVHARIDVDPNAMSGIEPKSPRHVILLATFAAGVFVGWLLNLFG